MGTRVFVWFEETTEATRVLYSYLKVKATTEVRKMHLDLYTQNAGLTQKAKFWCNYVSALKDARLYGPIGLLAPDNPTPRIPKPSILSLHRPMDITLYDLVYADEIYPNHPSQSHETQHEYRERLKREYEFECEQICKKHYQPL